MNRYTLVNGLGLPPRAAIASSWFIDELRRAHGPQLIPMSARRETYKQLERAVTRHHVRAASASFHYAPAARFIRQRAAAELRRCAHIWAWR
jgi:hypothetical protein